jgi:ATP-binding cassette subfamily C protein
MKKESLKDLIKSLFESKREFVLANIMAIVAVVVSLPIPLLIPMLIDEIILKKSSALTGFISQFFGKGDALFYIVVVLLATIFLMAVYTFFNVIQSYLFAKISKHSIANLQKRVVSYLTGVKMSEYENFGAGKISSLLVVDVKTVDDFLSITVNKFIISILVILGVGGVLLYIDWKLGLFILIFMPIVTYITKLISKKVGFYKRMENRAISNFQDELGENLELFWQVKASNKEDVLKRSLIQKIEQIKKSSIDFKFKSEASALLSYFLFLVGFEIFRSGGIFSVYVGDLSVGRMLGIFGYMWVISQPFSEVLSITYAYTNAKEALHRINTIFDMQKEREYPCKINPFLNSKTNSLELKDVTFSYQDGVKVLDGINIEAKRGEKIAIVGESGGGKSTIASLIVGFYEPQGGDILFDGISYKEIGFKTIREHVYLTLQNPLIFDGTIRYNLTLGEDIDEEKLHNAIQIAQLDKLINSLEYGLDERVGKNGVRLSGGQRQRLAIARMIVKEPNIVILDESTSSLDVETESKLFENLSSFLNKRTTIIIAHRLSTIKEADKIYLLEQGKVVESGSYDELIKKEGIFSRYIKKDRL